MSEHTDDTQVVTVDAQRTTHAIAAGKKLLIESLADHYGARTRLVIAWLPRATVAKRYVEHRKERTGSGQGIGHRRAPARLHRLDLDQRLGRHGLPIGLAAAPHVMRAGVVEQVSRMAAYHPLAGFGVELRIVDTPTTSRQRISGQEIHHRQRGHARTDADCNGDHHQCGQYTVALETPQR